MKLIAKIFEQSWEEAKGNQQAQKRKQRNTIKAYEKRQSEIEEVLPKTQNIKLHQKMEEERATLDAKIEIIQDSLEDNTFTEVRMKALLQKVQHLFEDPLAIRELGNQTMR
jgi:vacuolar-type H+-ATPase catalytic subunit A/Vma1